MYNKFVFLRLFLVFLELLQVEEPWIVIMEIASNRADKEKKEKALAKKDIVFAREQKTKKIMCSCCFFLVDITCQAVKA